MKVSKKVKRAIFAIVHEAMLIDGKSELEEEVRLVEHLWAHPLFAAMGNRERIALGEQALRELGKLPAGRALETLAPQVPPDLAEATLELTLRAIFVDDVFAASTEGTYLDRLAKALGIPDERWRPIAQRIIDEQNAARGGYRREE